MEETEIFAEGSHAANSSNGDDAGGNDSSGIGAEEEDQESGGEEREIQRLANNAASGASPVSSSDAAQSSGSDAKLQCAKCGREFSRSAYLNRHVQRMHAGIHKCESCDSKFDKYNELRKHISVAHPRLHRCSLCEYSHRHGYMVNRHVQQAHGQRSVMCSFDGCQALLPFNQLRRHVLDAHSNAGEASMTADAERRARARICAQKMFRENIGENPKFYRALSAVGEQSAPLRCDACGKHCETRDQLRRHVARVHERRYALHKREKRLACPEAGCEKSFKCAALLDDHINTHRAKRPYECLRCARSYASRASYARHLRKYHATSLRELTRPTQLGVDVVDALNGENIY